MLLGKARRLQDPLELEFQVLVPSNKGAGELMKNGNALSTEPSSLQLPVSLLLIFKSSTSETDSHKSVNT